MSIKFLSVLLVSLLLIHTIVYASDDVNDSNAIDRINNLRPGWRAGSNDRFVNMTLADASKMLGLAEDPVPVSPLVRNEDKIVSAQYLPDEFDSRLKWPDCVFPVRNQENCGGCWSFAASSVFTARQCIQSNAGLKVDIGPQYPISCDTTNGGCYGGTLSGAWRMYVTNGAIAEEDYPFESGSDGYSGMCQAKPNVKRYYAASFNYLRSVVEMQQSIYNFGPIQVGFDVYQDFYNYNSGVYRHITGVKVGGHSVFLVGWGVDGYGTPYWRAVNSWGTQFGMSGVFHILRGNNECNIELGYVPIEGRIVINPAYTTTAAPTVAPDTVAPATAPPTTTTTRAPTTTTTTTRPPTTTQAPASIIRTCWTCPAGMVHWYDIQGMAEPVDKCACVPTPTTAAPTYNCWTCPSGYIHWFNVPGTPQPNDRCACIPVPTTKAPTTTTTTTTTTTKAPTTTTTTRAPTTTTTKAPINYNCWTCPAGMVHWYDIPGTTQPADRCACIQDPALNNCWTCPAGMIHWYEVPGMAQPNDRCACIPRQARRGLNIVHNRLINRGF